MNTLSLSEEQIKKGAELLRRIRTDEGDVFIDCVNGEIDYYFIKFFDDGENVGVFLSLLFWGSFRIFIAFENDTDKYTHELAELIRLTKEKRWGDAPRAYFVSEQKKLIESLQKTIRFNEKSYYASHEFIMDKEHFKGYTNDKKLEVKPYEADRIDDYLLLLDNAMTFSPHDFQGNKKNMAEDLRKKEFFAFYKDKVLAGLYWLDNDFYTIDIMAVSPTHQRKGYGSIILSHAINNVLTKQNHNVAKLYCVDWNPKGISFYIKFGMILKGHTYSMNLIE